LEKTLIIGLGNILLTDEGIGVHIIKKLEELGSFNGAIYLDLGTSSWELINFIDNKIQKIFVIDCLNVPNGKPGDIHKLELKDLTSESEFILSLHQIKLLDSLKLILLETDLPKTIVIGIVPYDAKSISTELSVTLKNKFPDIINSVLNMISGRI